MIRASFRPPCSHFLYKSEKQCRVEQGREGERDRGPYAEEPETPMRKEEQDWRGGFAARFSGPVPPSALHAPSLQDWGAGGFSKTNFFLFLFLKNEEKESIMLPHRTHFGRRCSWHSACGPGSVTIQLPSVCCKGPQSWNSGLPKAKPGQCNAL